MTIYDIATIAGVSASTVSRVINDRPGVKEETRQRVKKLLKENNFIPNENARGLVNQVTKMIGILVADIRHSHHTEIAYVVERYLRSYGYCSLIMNAGSEPDMIVENIQILETRKVDGVIMIGSIFQNDAIKAGIKQHLQKVPVIVANGYINLPNVYGVLVDEEGGVRQCVELLYEKGYKQIAFVAQLTTVSSKQKFKGYELGILGHNPSGKVVMITAEDDMTGGYKATEQLMKQYPETDAVIYAEDIMALGALKYFRENNIRIPQKMGVMGINNAVYGEMSYPTVSSLDNRMKETGLVAATTLLEVLDGKEKVEKVMLFPKIVERESTDR